MNLKLTISCDDINPHPKYRLLGTPAEKWFRQLNDEFGVKFTCFVPSCYHGKYPISDHKEWIRELDSIEWLELAAHGHFHQTSDPKRFGECEWAEIGDEKIATNRLEEMLNEWNSCDIELFGFRFPGWVGSRKAKLIIDNYFDYVAVHYEHNGNMEWYYAKTFFGHDGIQQEHISIHNGDMIMFQSHIYGNHNHNVWNEQNYEQLRLSLTHLFENYTIEPKLLKECL